LYSLILGESILNDAISLVVYNSLQQKFGEKSNL